MESLETTVKQEIPLDPKLLDPKPVNPRSLQRAEELVQIAYHSGFICCWADPSYQTSSKGWGSQ